MAAVTHSTAAPRGDTPFQLLGRVTDGRAVLNTMLRSATMLAGEAADAINDGEDEDNNTALEFLEDVENMITATGLAIDHYMATLDEAVGALRASGLAHEREVSRDLGDDATVVTGKFVPDLD